MATPVGEVEVPLDDPPATSGWGLRSGPEQRLWVLARAAAVLFLGSGLLTIVSAELGPAGATRLGTLAIALLAIASGIGVWVAPWERWPARASLWLAPLALALVAGGNFFSSMEPYDYAVYFVVVHAWIGMAHPRRTSLALSPLTALAYALPLPFIAPDPEVALLTAVTVVPLCILVGESIAWLRSQLDTSEADGRRLAAALASERKYRRRLRELHERVRTSDRRHRTLIEQMPAVTYLRSSGATSTISYVSPQIEGLVGVTVDEWKEDPELQEAAVDEEDRPVLKELWRRSNETGEAFLAEYRLRNRSGDVVWVRDEAVLVEEQANARKLWQGVLFDITAKKRAEEQLSFLAYHDPVTDLPNRALFEEHLDRALAGARRAGKPLAVCALDLDKFKLINDTLGHSAGDEFLRTVASRLERCLRREDVLARVGGDEFFVLLPFAHVPESQHTFSLRSAAALTDQIMARMAAALEESFVMADVEYRLSASVGAALYPRDGLDARSLIDRADAAMYRRKRERSDARSGGTTQEDEDPLLAARLESATRLEAWELRYQPIVELVKERPVGAEALLRWKDHRGVVITPAEFIPLAEEMGLISRIGDWVIQELTNRVRIWQRQGVLRELSAVTFNVSARQLWHPALLERIDGLVHAVGRRDVVVLEITESALGMDPARAHSILEAVREVGARVALDDFGTGYSSLSRLRTLPIDIVKIDRSFMEGVETDASARAVVRSMIRLASGLGMVPLAEGIETGAQLNFVRSEGCVLAQGHHLGRPQRATEFARRVKTAGAGPRELESADRRMSAIR